MAMAKTKSDNYWEPHARILESMPRFQTAISDVRKRLGIPDTGIPFDDRAEWFSDFYRNADEDTASDTEEHMDMICCLPIRSCSMNLIT
jgi:hypothetical protein